MGRDAEWVTVLTTSDLAKASTAQGMLQEQGIETRFFQLPPCEIQVLEGSVDQAKAFLKEWGLLPNVK